jgi:hypothetical protein
MHRSIRAALLVSAFTALVATAACKKSGDAAAADGGAAGSSPGVLATVASALGLGFEGDVTMHTTSSHGPPQDLTFHVKGQKLRVDVPEQRGEQAHAIFDQSTNKILVVMDTQKMYMELDPSAAQAHAAAAHAPATVTETGKHETVAGTDCEDWDIVEASGKRASVCIAKGLAFFDFGGGMRPGGGESASAWMDELRAKKAFPLKAVETDATGKEISRMEVTKIEKKSLDDSLFTVPAGYRSMSAMIPSLAGHAGVPGAPKAR